MYILKKLNSYHDYNILVYQSSVIQPTSLIPSHKVWEHQIPRSIGIIHNNQIFQKLFEEFSSQLYIWSLPKFILNKYIIYERTGTCSGQFILQQRHVHNYLIGFTNFARTNYINKTCSGGITNILTVQSSANLSPWSHKLWPKSEIFTLPTA